MVPEPRGTLESAKISNVGIDFSSWTETSGIHTTDGAVFVMNPELNIVDGNTSATSTTLATADRFVCNDNGTMKQVSLANLVTFLEDGSTSGFDINGGTY